MQASRAPTASRAACAVSSAISAKRPGGAIVQQVRAAAASARSHASDSTGSGIACRAARTPRSRNRPQSSSGSGPPARTSPSSRAQVSRPPPNIGPAARLIGW
ncbi:hypothetical protein [Actinomadura madurae]|uniref:hypothetical protein n=1 Tax=Actinomadura madurae TaxID=1993 RepID=UPI0020272D05|nr:hypothetical protein [Actinomadura madurae]MCQ0004083.1 hypothetical protein [Actinomadura madurae]URN02758.1 hypothetical protein LUW74_04885 [Actinomadura madurae]